MPDATATLTSAGVAFAAAGAAQTQVRQLVAGADPVVSAYLPLAHGRVPEQPFDRELRWRGLAARARADGAPDEVLDRLGARVAAAAQAAGVLTLITDADGQVAFEAVLADDRIAELVTYGVPALVRPLLAWQHRAMAYVHAAVDRTGADIIGCAGRGAPVERQTLVGSDDEIERNAPGGWAGLAQTRYARRAEDSWRHNTGQVAAALVAEADRCAAEAVFVCGDVRAVQLLEEQLPAQHRWTLHRVSGNRATPHLERDRGLLRDLAEADAAREGRILREFGERLGPAGLAVQGAADTLAALRADQVELLVVTDRTGGGRVAWFGADAQQVYVDHTEAIALSGGVPVDSGPLADVAVRSALLGGARVRVVPAEAAGAPADGLGAFTRYG